MTAVTTQPADAGAAPVSNGAVSAATGVAVPDAAPAVVAVPSLKRNFLLTLGGNVTYAACQWGILVVLAKLINPEMVGQFVLGVAVAAPVFFLANLQLANIQATDARRQTPFETYLRLRILTTVLGAVVLVAIIAVCAYPVRTSAIILIVGAAKALDALIDIFHGLYQQQERMRHVSASLIANGVASLGLTALAVWWTRDVLWGAAAFALGSLASLVLYNLPVGAAVWRATVAGPTRPRSLAAAVAGGPWDLGVLWRLAWLALPLGFASALVTFNGNLPRYFIHADYGDRPLAIFAAMAYVMTAGVTFVGALCNAAVPRLARRWADRDFTAFNRIVFKVTLVALAAGAAGVAVAVVAGRPLLAIVYTPEYAQHYKVFVWIMCSAAVTYVSSVLAYAVSATRSFRLLTAPYVASTLATLAACWLLIPRFGLLGAAWAIAVSGATGCAGAAWVLHTVRRRAHSASDTPSPLPSPAGTGRQGAVAEVRGEVARLPPSPPGRGRG